MEKEVALSCSGKMPGANCFCFTFICIFSNIFVSFSCLFSCQAARHSHTAVEWQGNMVIYGGELNNHSLASDLWLYQPQENDWQQLGLPNAPGAPKLANHAAAVVDIYLYVFGGEWYSTTV